jgi:hypothetical protein
MENQNQDAIVEIDYINIPVILFHGKPENIESNLVFTVDDNGIRNLATSEEDAKKILYSSINQSKDEQELLLKFKEEDNKESSVFIELSPTDKNYLKSFTYDISLEFVGYNAENNKPQFRIIKDNISGSPDITIKSLNNSKIIKEQLQLF